MVSQSQGDQLNISNFCLFTKKIADIILSTVSSYMHLTSVSTKQSSTADVETIQVER